MVFVGVLVGIIITGAMIYMALNKKLAFHVRLASLGALAVMILTVIICLIIFFTDDKVHIDPSTLIVGEPVRVEEEDNLWALFVSIIFLLALFGVIAFLVFREHKKSIKQ